MGESIAIALDLGTTNIKGGILGINGTLSPIFVEPTPTVVQTENRFESDAFEYLQVCERVLNRVIDTTPKKLPLGISFQRSTFVIWDSDTGYPVSPLISWQDSRAELLCRRLNNQSNFIRGKTGLRLTPYFFGPKLAAVLDENPEWLEGLKQNSMHVGTLDSFIIWHWSHPYLLHTDLSMAARTLLVDIENQRWSSQLANLFSISTDYLPNIDPSEGVKIPLKQGINAVCTIADQSSAMVALSRDQHDYALVNLGTGGFVSTPLNESQRLNGPNGYQMTLLYQDSKFKTHYALEGTINSIGPALSQFSPEIYRLNDDPSLTNIFCVSEASGLGAPFYRDDIKAQYSQSISRLNDRQIAQLILEGVIFRISQILDDFTRLCDVNMVYLAGGWSRLPALQQGLAQLYSGSIFLLEEKESSLLGAAQLASQRKKFPPVRRAAIEKTTGFEYLVDRYDRWRVWLEQRLQR